MNYRIKFSKFNNMKYIGHLDLMRFFQKALIRAHFPLTYSKGFNPHPLLSFALPLSVGVTSEGEYMDVVLESEISETKYLDRLNHTMPDGIKILDIRLLLDKENNAMSALGFAKYRISILKEYYSDLTFDRWEDFYINDSIEINKKTKKGERILNIKPHILYYDIKDNTTIELVLSAGSKENLPPLLVMQAYCNFINDDFEKEGFSVHRIQMYKDAESNEIDNLESL